MYLFVFIAFCVSFYLCPLEKSFIILYKQNRKKIQVRLEKIKWKMTFLGEVGVKVPFYT